MPFLSIPDHCANKGAKLGIHIHIRHTHMHTSYTKYGIWCHMVLYVTMVTFWVTLLMNK
jgi:hypothetical protein